MGQDKGDRGKADQIMNAADRVFAHFGYKRTAMEDVAKEAGVAKGTLYLYFESKEALFRAILDRSIQAAERACDAAEVRGGTLEEQFYAQLNAWFGTTVERYGAYEHLPELSSVRGSVGKDIAEVADQRFESRLVRILEAAQRGGQESLKDLKLTPKQVIGLLLATARGSKYTGRQTQSLTEFRQELRRIARLFAKAASAK